MNIIINSEMRVGSRWLHYLLAELYNMRPSPEVDRGVIDERLPLIKQYMANARIAKFHHTVQTDIFRAVKPVNYKVISVVRNPRDRVVSKAFHMRYDKDGSVKHFNSDWDAVRKCIKDPYFEEANHRQILQMQDGYSTRAHYNNDLPYIWTAYEWMLEDIEREVTTISEFLGADVNKRRIIEVCKNHSFKTKTGREPGEEQRNNRWRRKGIIGDWVNWFDRDMLHATRKPQELYWDKLLGNRGV